MKENPGAYQAARKHILDSEEREKVIRDQVTEHFEKQKKTVRTTKKFDVFELRHRIETGNSLSTLRQDIIEALQGGYISRELYDNMRVSLDRAEYDKNSSEEDAFFIDPESLPLGNTQLARFFEKQRLGQNTFIDIAGFFYGFFAQGSAILVILLWRILMDLIFLPRDILLASSSEL